MGISTILLANLSKELQQFLFGVAHVARTQYVLTPVDAGSTAGTQDQDGQEWGLKLTHHLPQEMAE